MSGIVRLPDYDAYFYVRGFTDDLYSVTPKREGSVEELILGSLRTGDNFVDVGANIGYYTILVGKAVGDYGQVVSVEPVSATVKVLEFNVKLNRLSNVKIITKAAWSEEATLRLCMPKGYYGWASVVRTHPDETQSVGATSLDNICNEMPSIRMVKVDAEGSEYQILKGAQRTLKKTNRLVIECSNNSEQVSLLLNESSFTVQGARFESYMYAVKNLLSDARASMGIPSHNQHAKRGPA